MRLGEWLVQEKISAAEFAKRLAVDRASVSRWVNGEYRPRWEQVEAIERVTNGAVCAADFVVPPASIASRVEPSSAA